MKTFSIAVAVALGATVASAQSVGFLHGQKVLLDKFGNVVQQAPIINLPTSPLVGGADSCVTPDVISGAGPFAFDTTLATTGAEGQAEPLCNNAAQIGLNNDVWFTWTATFTGPARVSLCGMASFDSKVAIYAGNTCPGAAAIACNDDFCGLQSQVDFPAVSGNNYVIQIGQYGTVAPTPGSFTLGAVPPPPPPPINDDCTAPIAISGPGTYSFDNTNATTATQYAATCGAIYKDAWWTYTAASTGTATLTTCGFMMNPPGNTFDTKVAVYAGTGCPTVTSIACNDDSCTVQTFASTLSFPTTCGTQYTIRVGNFSSTLTVNAVGAFNIVESGTPCAAPGIPYCFGDGSGTACPCGNNGAPGNGCASSVNPAGGNLATSGSPSVSSDTLVLTATGLPTGACLYFQGTTQLGGGAGVAFGDGLRCTGGTVVRLGTKQNPGGTSSYPVAGDPPIHIKGNDVAGDVRDYQCWYRNAAVFCTPSTFNLTNGVQVTWAP